MGFTATVYTLGCRVNIYESEQIKSVLSDMSFDLVPIDDTPDLLIVNSCAVTAESSKKSMKIARRGKSRNENCTVILCGCAAEENPDLCEKGFIDCLIGNSDKIKNVSLAVSRIFNIPLPEKNVYLPLLSSTRAFIKIQDGCGFNCSYCIIPQLRGKNISREREDILKEIKSLAKRGYTDFTITGIELCIYDKGLPELIDEIAQIEEVKRIRLGSLDPRLIDEDFFKRISKSGKVCDHFHISVQSGSGRILKLMNRSYDAQDILKETEYIKRHFPHATFSADIIAGFPTETDADFEETVSLCKTVGFMHIHSFPYSKRKNTAASEMENQIPEAVKKARVKALNDLGDENYSKIKTDKIGKEGDVLFEERDGGYYRARFTDFTEIYIETQTDNLSGKYFTVKATEIDKNGRLIGTTV